jgi:hypothetical protein
VPISHVRPDGQTPCGDDTLHIASAVLHWPISQDMPSGQLPSRSVVEHVGGTGAQTPIRMRDPSPQSTEDSRRGPLS